MDGEGCHGGVPRSREYKCQIKEHPVSGSMRLRLGTLVPDTGNRPLFLCERLIQAHEGGDAFAFGHAGREAVGGHDGAVVLAVGLAQFGRHESKGSDSGNSCEA